MTDLYKSDAIIEKWRNPNGWKAVVAISFIALSIVTVGMLVYETGGTAFVWLNMMYLPIILAAAVYRVAGGAAAALVGGLALGPYMPLHVSQGIPQDCANWLLRAGVFMLVGIVTDYLFTWIDRQPYQGLPLKVENYGPK